jgi:hypothetical protein
VIQYRIIALIMEAASTSETSVNFYRTTRRNNPEHSHLQCGKSFLSLSLKIESHNNSTLAKRNKPIEISRLKKTLHYLINYLSNAVV